MQHDEDRMLRQILSAFTLDEPGTQDAVLLLLDIDDPLARLVAQDLGVLHMIPKYFTEGALRRERRCSCRSRH